MYDEESISLEVQEGANRGYCDRQDYDVVAVITDEGISGRKWENRPGAIESVRMVEDDEADIVVAWKWSRVSRRRLNFEIAVDRVESVGGRVESSTEPIDVTTASGRFQRGVFADLAELQSEQIGEGWREAHAYRRGRGVPHAGGDRYGYTREWNPSPGHGVRGWWSYAIDEGGETRDETNEITAWRQNPAEALRLAYRWYLDGRGVITIVRELNARGYRNRIGQPFKRYGLLPLLDSGFAAGLIKHQPRDREGRPIGDPEYHQGAHTPIIDTDTWDAYRATRRVRAGTPPASAGSSHPLSGLLRCGDCGAHMTAYSTPSPQNRTGNQPTYACNRWRSLGSEWVRCVTTRKSRAERIVREWLEGLASDVEAAADADEKATKRHRRARGEAKRAVGQLADLEQQMAALTLAKVRGEVSAVGYDTARREIEQAVEKARAAAEEAELAALRPPPGSRSTAGRLAQVWDMVPGEDIRAGLGLLIRGVWVYPPTKPGAGSTVVVVSLWEPAPHIVAPALPDEPTTKRRRTGKPKKP